MNNCNFCNKSINNKGSLKAHEMCCKDNPKKIKRKRSEKAGLQKGNIPWNKGKVFKEKSINELCVKIESNSYKTLNSYTIRTLIRKYLIQKHGNICMICGISEWLGVSIPLVCDHIDGNSENNELNNFRIICNNCDSILPTFKGKNRGKGRKNRYAPHNPTIISNQP